MEYLDIFDENGEKTGRVFERSRFSELKDGQYMLAVHVYIVNSGGLWLLQKRSMQKRFMPGLWDVTAGAVCAGEDSRETALRETREELGIDLPPAGLKLFARLRRSRSFIDLWWVRADFELSDCVLQQEEVDAVKWVDTDEMLRLVYEAEFRDDAYISAVRRLAEAWREENRAY